MKYMCVCVHLYFNDALSIFSLFNFFLRFYSQDDNNYDWETDFENTKHEHLAISGGKKC